MTLLTCLDGGGTGGGRGSAAIAHCSRSSSAWYWTRCGSRDCTMGAWGFISSLVSCALILANHCSDARWQVSIMLYIRFWLWKHFLRSSLLRLKLMLRIFVILSSWLLMRLDNCALCAAEVLAVFCTLAVVRWSNPVLAACWAWRFWTCARMTSFFCHSCSNWTRRPWNCVLLEVGS